MFDGSKCEELRILECGREKCVPEKQICNKKKTYHLVHYVTAGKGYAEIEGKKYALRKGDLFFIKENTAALYYPDKENPWSYIWVGFAGLLSDSILNKCGISPQNPIFKDDPQEELREDFYRIYNHYSKLGKLDFACLGYFYVAISTISEIVSAREKQPLVSAKSRHVHEACEYIANNFQFSITVKDIANSVCISPNYLANIFLEELSCSPKQYLTKYRMDKACTYLKASDYSIKDVALGVGYKEQLHFSSEFKKVMGVSPLNYRKQSLTNGN